MKYSGTLEYRDLGAGQWVLNTSSGIVSLFGKIDGALDGKHVEVTGEKASGVSAGMVSADAVMVKSVRAL